MHGLRLLRVLVPLAIVAVIVGGIVSVASARPRLQKAERAVDRSWSPLSSRLNQRYALLSAADDRLRPMPGPVGDIAGMTHTAVVSWQTLATSHNVPAQVQAANNLEALGHRLVTTARASAAVRADATATAAVEAFARDNTFSATAATDAVATFNRAVSDYQKERRGPLRSLVASVLGEDDVPAFSPAPLT